MMNMLPINLPYYRRQAGYTQQEVADRLGVTKQAVSSWEKGPKQPTPTYLAEMAEMYDCTTDDLLYERRYRRETQ